MCFVRLFVLLVVPFGFSSGNDSNCNSISIIDQCRFSQTCHECIRNNICCNWCYQEPFQGKYKCDIMDNLKSHCNTTHIETNEESNINNTSSKDFTDYKNDENTIQIKPQKFHLTLRKDSPVNITIQYRPAKDYPLYLYFLMDLSFSMRRALNEYQNITTSLISLLEELTLNHKLAYGSFMDKPGLPFYRTDSVGYTNPCHDDLEGECEQGYLFRHYLNFTDDVSLFTKKVHESKITANLDNVDGALDAIMQILVCNHFGWQESSRKMIIVMTQSKLHMAGDGILAGAIKRNIEKCLTSFDGNYTDPLEYDYPSLEQILLMLKNKKVNLIFATNEELVQYYNEVEKLPFAKGFLQVKKMNETGVNVLDIVKTTYSAVFNQVKFFINTTQHDYIDVQYFAKCGDSSTFEKIDSCQNVQLNNIYEFTFQLTMTDYPDNDVDKILLKISENNLHENIEIDANFISICKCVSYKSKKREEYCEHGVYRCGSCSCNKGWTGKNCRDNCEDSVEKCRLEEGRVSCEGHGDCQCGKCICKKQYQGTFCNLTCPFNRKLNKLCSGHGNCLNETTCKCNNGYEGNDCSCSLSTDLCKMPYQVNECFGNGKCICNKCYCNSGFKGIFCETSSTTLGNKICLDYNPYISNFLTNEANKIVANVTMNKVLDSIVDENSPSISICELSFTDSNRYCYVKYFYKTLNDWDYTLNIYKYDCALTASLKSISMAGIFFALIVGFGIIAIFVYKKRNDLKDKREYEQFVKEQKRNPVVNENPLYKNPVTTFPNVQYRELLKTAEE